MSLLSTGMKAKLLKHADTLLLGTALLILATVFLWWGIFAGRMINEAEMLRAQFQPALAIEAASRATRQRWMIAGEGGLLLVCLLMCCVGLFFVARRQRRHAQQLQSATQMTTHELKTPIAAVRALLQSLQLGSLPPARVGPLLQQGLAECGRLERLAETLLAHQRAVQLGQQQLSAIDVPVFVEGLLRERSAASLPAASVDADSSLWALADADALRVVIDNLLDNAIKYGAGSPVRVEIRSQGQAACVAVVDQGVGFAPADADNLFTPFVRALPHDSRGSGVGLSIARTLARRMRGDLVGKSEGVGRGARFVLTLPMATDVVS
jgi:signal transduction histidine kinase